MTKLILRTKKTNLFNNLLTVETQPRSPYTSLLVEQLRAAVPEHKAWKELRKSGEYSPYVEAWARFEFILSTLVGFHFNFEGDDAPEELLTLRDIWEGMQPLGDAKDWAEVWQLFLYIPDLITWELWQIADNRILDPRLKAPDVLSVPLEQLKQPGQEKNSNGVTG